MKKVAIIGAGPSGITALKNIAAEGLDVVCFEKNTAVGGNWIFSEEKSHSSVFETTHIISSKTLSEYSDFPFSSMENEVADYPSHNELRHYFQAYAKTFCLEQFIRFETEVLHCHLLNDDFWEIEFRNKDGVQRERFSHLVVCNGHHFDPRMPHYPGDFSGRFMHSHDYKKAAPFKDQKVLVIGGGNSACDVAVETSRVSQKTMISWRRGYRIIPKFFMGKPSDIHGEKMAFLPLFVRKKLASLLIFFTSGSNKMYGLQEPDHAFGSTHPTVNDELLYRIRHGKIHPRVDVQELQGNTVLFKDGKREAFDVIIACTGFRISHPFFDKDLIDFSNGKVKLYKRFIHPEISSLYFLGLVQPFGCVWPLSELQSKIVASELTGKWKRPQNLSKLGPKKLYKEHYKQIETGRHTITVDFFIYRKDLQNMLK